VLVHLPPYLFLNSFHVCSGCNNIVGSVEDLQVPEDELEPDAEILKIPCVAIALLTQSVLLALIWLEVTPDHFNVLLMVLELTGCYF